MYSVSELGSVSLYDFERMTMDMKMHETVHNGNIRIQELPHILR